MKKIYIIAVVAALLSSVLIYGFLSSYDKKNGDGSVNYKTEKVVVALTDIPAACRRYSSKGCKTESRCSWLCCKRRYCG